METTVSFLKKSACEKNKTEGPLYSPEAAVAFVGVEAAAWIRAWGGIRMVARGGLLDSSRETETKVRI